MGQTETSREGEEESFQTTEGSQYIQEDLQHGISGSEQPKLQRLLAGITNTGVNNISSYIPSSDELCVLALGLNYIPESKDISNFEILQAFNEFEETLLACEKPTQHSNNAHDTNPVNILKRKLKQKHRIKYGTDGYKINEPPILKDYHTKSYLDKVHKNIQKIIKERRSTIHKLSQEESETIDAIVWNLKTNELIVIKPADKNLGPTIMDHQWYISAGELILQDKTTYRTIKSFDINSIRNELIVILAKFGHVKFKNKTTDMRYGSWQSEPMFILLQKYLTYQTPLAETLLEPFLNPESFQACRGYFLPKLQKMGLPLPINPPLIAGRTPPMRPICASIGWVTYAVSLFLDIILKPIMLKLDSYIMSSATLAKEFQTTIFPPECALLSADVDSLYPSIDLNRGLDAINEALQTAKTSTQDREFTIYLLRWVLFNNILEFNGKLYLQVRGTAMGTPCAVVFACIFMGMLERRALSLARE